MELSEELASIDQVLDELNVPSYGERRVPTSREGIFFVDLVELTRIERIRLVGHGVALLEDEVLVEILRAQNRRLQRQIAQMIYEGRKSA